MGKEGHNVKQITFCTDNDKTGREFANKNQRFINKNLSNTDCSNAKDWNEELKNKNLGRKIITKKTPLIFDGSHIRN